MEQSRAQLFAQRTLRKNSEAITFALRSRTLVIGIPEALAETRHGQIAIVTAVNILSRLGALAPNLCIDVHDDARVLPGVPLLLPGQPLGKSLLTFMHRLAAFQPGQVNRGCGRPSQHYDYGLFIGSTTTDVSNAVTIGSDKWIATINPKGEEETVNIDDENPLGVILAATLGSIEVVKQLWLPIKDPTVIMEPIPQRTIVSAYNFSVNNKDSKNPALPANRMLGHTCIIGLGAIGSACNYILGCFPELNMSLDLVDMDVIEPSNEERLFTGSDPKRDVGQPKATHAEQFITGLHKNIRAFAYQMPFEHYVDMSRERLGYVWCCLDSVRARRLLQTELSTVLVNGGTDMSRWMLSLHEFDRPENACLQDLYQEPKERYSDPVSELAHFLGVNPRQILRVAAGRGRFDAGIIALAAQRQQDPAMKKRIASFAGLTLEQALAHKCSQGGPSNFLPAATISFVSLMPAIFMVADMIKRRLYGWRQAKSEPNVFQFDCFRLLEKATVCNVLAAKSCLCQSERYHTAFQKRQELRRKYSSCIFSKPAVPSPLQRRPALFKPHIPVAAVPIRPVMQVQYAANNEPVAWQVHLLPRKHHRVLAILLLLVALAVYIAGMTGSMWPVGLFVQHENKKVAGFQPWRLVHLAYTTKTGAWPWLKYMVISGLPVAAYPILMLTSTKMVRWARVLYSGGERLVARPNSFSRLAAIVLTIFFASTGTPFVSVGSLAFGAINARLLFQGCKKVTQDTCCFVVPCLLLAGYCLFCVCFVGLLQTLGPTWARCAKIFDIAIPKRK